MTFREVFIELCRSEDPDLIQWLFSEVCGTETESNDAPEPSPPAHPIATSDNDARSDTNGRTHDSKQARRPLRATLSSTLEHFVRAEHEV